jgi:hypothetical protein
VSAEDRRRRGIARAGKIVRAILIAVLPAAMLAGCASGDFGRLRPSLVSDNMHAWIGTEAALAQGIPASKYPLTDDERLLRDLAFPLIDPPYNRQRWFGIVNDYGLNRIFRCGYAYDVSHYHAVLAGTAYRSATARYSKLNEDVRNEIVRMDPFFDLARRVLATDRRREQSLAYVSNLTPGEQGNALARIAENALVIGWVQQAVAERADAYRFSLERLVIATPAPMAAEVDTSLQLMRQRIATNQVVAAPQVSAIAVPSPLRVAAR